jgi:uncharacterized membrane protein
MSNNSSAKLFTDEEQTIIVDAIKSAELHTSGEIRIHIESTCDKNVMDRAIEVFFKLNMDATEQDNGVLVYLGFESKKMAIIGGKGINDKVPDDFWNETLNLLKEHFVNENYVQGLCNCVTEIGNKLVHYFPIQSNDTNELSNDISFGE